MWAARVRAVLDDVAAYRAAAQAAAALRNDAAAADLLDKAFRLEDTGRLEGPGVGQVDRAAAVAAWAAHTNIDPSDPEQVRRVYDAVADIQRQRAERDARAAAAQRAAQARAVRGQPRAGKMRPPQR